MTFVDTHSHAHFKQYAKDPQAMLARGAEVGVTKTITVGVSVQDSQKAVKFASGREGVWASIGSHPHSATEFLNDFKSSVSELEHLAKDPKVVAIGEIGLDYYRKDADRKSQQTALKAQLEFASALNKPIIFHIRDAWEDFWPIYDSFGQPKGVVHSFSAGLKQLDACLSRGLYVALNGIMTFTRDEAQLKAAKETPSNMLLLETDAPFLTPAPFRDTICEIRHVVDIARFLSEIRGETMQELADATTHNAVKLFNLE